MQHNIQHLAVIMDGNRRWAKARGLDTAEGHKAGLHALKKLVRLCPKYKIKHLSAYAFSTENWKRSQIERDFIFMLLEEAAIKDLEALIENGVRVDFWGNFDKFQNSKLLETIRSLEARTAHNDTVHLHIAFSYGSYQEFYDAYKQIGSRSELASLDTQTWRSRLYSASVPDPEILIRTGGEKRLSNYLLYQAAYAHLNFIDDYWPDFGEQQLNSILEQYHASCSLQS